MMEFKINYGLFNEVKFLASALNTSRDEGRFHVNHIKVEDDGSAVATDGMRLHAVDNLPIAPGFYKVVKNIKRLVQIEKVEELANGSFPPTAELLEKPTNAKWDDRLALTDDPVDLCKTYAEIIRAMGENTIRYEFLADIGEWFDEYNAEVIINDADSALHFINGNKHALVMPVRI
jgi:hypothetical protein